MYKYVVESIDNTFKTGYMWTYMFESLSLYIINYIK